MLFSLCVWECDNNMDTITIHKVGKAGDAYQSVGRGRGVLMYTPLSKSTPSSQSELPPGHSKVKGDRHGRLSDDVVRPLPSTGTH